MYVDPTLQDPALNLSNLPMFLLLYAAAAGHSFCLSALCLKFLNLVFRAQDNDVRVQFLFCLSHCFRDVVIVHRSISEQTSKHLDMLICHLDILQI